VEAGPVAGLVPRAPVGDVDGVVVVQDGLQAVAADDCRSAGDAQVAAVVGVHGPAREVPALEAVGEQGVGPLWEGRGIGGLLVGADVGGAAGFKGVEEVCPAGAADDPGHYSRGRGRQATDTV